MSVHQRREFHRQWLLHSWESQLYPWVKELYKTVFILQKKKRTKKLCVALTNWQLLGQGWALSPFLQFASNKSHVPVDGKSRVRGITHPTSSRDPQYLNGALYGQWNYGFKGAWMPGLRPIFHPPPQPSSPVTWPPSVLVSEPGTYSDGRT